MKLYGVSAQFADGHVVNIPIKASRAWEALAVWQRLNHATLLEEMKQHGDVVQLCAKLVSTPPQLDAGAHILRSDGTGA